MVGRERERERERDDNVSRTDGEWQGVCCLIPLLPASDFAHPLNISAKLVLSAPLECAPLGGQLYSIP